jgi:gas vesicle protein
MRFIIGLLLGLGVGFVGALLLAPEKRERREGAPAGEEPLGEEGFGGNHDSMAGLRRAMRGLQEQLQEAWEEAREASREAEEEMRARYQRTVPKKGRE